MPKVIIPLNGISTSSSYSDGDAFTLTNLRKKNGSLRPVTPRQPLYALYETWDELFIHQLPGTGQNWIGVKFIEAHDTSYPYQGAWSGSTSYTTGQCVLWEGAYHYANVNTSGSSDYPNGSPNWELISGGSIIGSNYIVHFNDVTNLYYISNLSDDTKNFLCTVTSIPTITQIGNVLNILDNSGLKYLIWYESNYVLIDSNFDGDQTTFNDPVGMIDLRVDAVTNSEGTELREFYTDSPFGYSSLGEADLPANRQLRANAGNALLNKALSVVTRDGFLTGFCMICTAIELYDGSYILQSRPVLLCQANDLKTRYQNQTAYGIDGTVNYDDVQIAYDAAKIIIAPYTTIDGTDDGYSEILPTHAPDGYKLFGWNNPFVFKNESRYPDGAGSMYSTRLVGQFSLMSYWQKINNLIISLFDLKCKPLLHFIATYHKYGTFKLGLCTHMLKSNIICS